MFFILHCQIANVKNSLFSLLILYSYSPIWSIPFPCYQPDYNLLLSSFFLFSPSMHPEEGITHQLSPAVTQRSQDAPRILFECINQHTQGLAHADEYIWQRKPTKITKKHTTLLMDLILHTGWERSCMKGNTWKKIQVVFFFLKKDLIAIMKWDGFFFLKKII